MKTLMMAVMAAVIVAVIGSAIYQAGVQVNRRLTVVMQNVAGK